MTKLCNFHPDRPAQFECKQCGIAWCLECIDTNTIQTYGIAGGQKAQYYCPTCNRPVRKVVVKEKQNPWRNIAELLLEPLQAHILMIMLPVSMQYFSCFSGG